ncbi:MAG: hypothetical protein R3C68_10185 [Myxococcota bacterium]
MKHVLESGAKVALASPSRTPKERHRHPALSLEPVGRGFRASRSGCHRG